MFDRQIETDVAIKVSINRVARITGLRAPNFEVRFAIARKNRRPCRSVRGRKDGSLRARLRPAFSSCPTARFEHCPMAFQPPPMTFPARALATRAPSAKNDCRYAAVTSSEAPFELEYGS